MNLRIVTTALAGLAMLGAGTASAQDWPTKPVRIITGFAAGGIGDLGARPSPAAPGSRPWSRTAPAPRARSA
jgi:tripartite-type tricarboxylate transporter receptor subunit TctC